MTIADIIKTHVPEASDETLLLSPLFSIYSWHMDVGRGGEKEERMRSAYSRRSQPLPLTDTSY